MAAEPAADAPVSAEMKELMVRRLLDMVGEILQAEDAQGTLVFPLLMREPLLRIMDARVRVALDNNIFKDMKHVQAFLYTTLTTEAPALAKTHEQAINILFPFAPKQGDAVEVENVRGTCVVTSRVFEDNRGREEKPAAERERTLIITYDCLHPSLKNKSLIARFIYDPAFAFATFIGDDEAIGRALAARRALSGAAAGPSIKMVESSRARPAVPQQLQPQLQQLAPPDAPLPRVLGKASAEELAVLAADAAINAPAMERELVRAATQRPLQQEQPRHTATADEYYESLFSAAASLPGAGADGGDGAWLSADEPAGREELVTEFTGRSETNPPDASAAAEARRRAAADAAEQRARAEQANATAAAAAPGLSGPPGDEAWQELLALYAGKPDPLTLPADADLLTTYPDADMATVERVGRMWEGMASEFDSQRERELRAVDAGGSAVPAKAVAAAAETRAAPAGEAGVKTGARTQRKVLACVAALGREPVTPALLMSILRFVARGGDGADARPLDEADALDMPQLPLSMKVAFEEELRRSAAGESAGLPGVAAEPEEELSESEIAADVEALLRATDDSGDTGSVLMDAKRRAAAAAGAAAASGKSAGKPGAGAQGGKSARERTRASVLAEVLDGAPLYRLEEVDGFPQELVPTGSEFMAHGKGKKVRPRLPWMDKKKRR
jgi:hypothetical protein